MSKNDPITCFNQAECVYIKCGVYNDTLSVCELEWLKRVRSDAAAKPSQVQAAAGRVQQPSTPFNNPPMPQEQASQQKGPKPFTRCADVVYGMKNIKIHGKVMDDPVSQELKTRKGQMTVVKFRMDDGTSQIRLTFWAPNKVPNIKVGDEITIDSLMGGEPYDGMPQASGNEYVKIIFEKV